MSSVFSVIARVFLDGGQDPATAWDGRLRAPGHSWYGESVGHYEGGNILVVDTIGQNDKTQIDRFGTTHSDKIHVVERYRLSPNGEEFEVQFTVEDPGAFTMPWSGRARFRSREGNWDEQICAENNRHIGLVTIRGVRTTDVQTASDGIPRRTDGRCRHRIPLGAAKTATRPPEALPALRTEIPGLCRSPRLSR